jgi:hypothetical protein
VEHPKDSQSGSPPFNVMEFGPAEGFHVGFAERGLKSWAKQPARTAQKQSGGIFEKLVSSCMHEHTMMEKAVLHMSDENWTRMV